MGYYNNNGRCDVSPTNSSNNTNNNSTNNNTNSTTTPNLGKIVPFPYTISYVLVVGISIGMKCLYPGTLFASVLMSFGSIL